MKTTNPGNRTTNSITVTTGSRDLLYEFDATLGAVYLTESRLRLDRYEGSKIVTFAARLVRRGVSGSTWARFAAAAAKEKSC